MNSEVKFLFESLKSQTVNFEKLVQQIEAAFEEPLKDGNENENEKLVEENKKLKVDIQTHKQNIADRFKELATLTKMLEDQRQELEVLSNYSLEQKSRIQKLYSLKNPSVEEHTQVLKSSGLFDKEWYIAQYADKLPQDLDPQTHYMLIGAFEGYNPSQHFDSAWYMENYPDVAESEYSINPLVHYIKFGQSEGRAPKP